MSVSGSPVTTSGTLALAFSGTTSQYIRGNGTLANFPTNLVSGTGTTNHVTKWSSTSGEIINSGIVDIGGSIYNALTTAGQFAWQFNGDTTTGQSYGALINAGTNASDIALRIQNASSTSVYFYVWGDGKVQINNIPNATTDTDKFLVSDSGVIKYRTGSELLSDIGAQPSGTYVTSVGVTRSGDALSITGSPVTSSGTINIGFAGSTSQYIRGDGTLATMPSIISQAQNLVTEVYNETGATLTKGTIVYINGGHGNLPTVTKALATGDSTSAQTYGIVQADITNNNNGYVVAAGRLLDIDTQAYAAGTQLYLSSTTAGTYTSTKQYAPAHLVYVGIIVRSHPTQGVIEVKIQNGYELDELHNVSAQTPSNNNGLFYNTSTSLWENKSIATALGYTPISLSSLSAVTPLSYNSGTGAFSISAAGSGSNGFLSSTDWNTFNNKQSALNGTGFVKISGTTISYDNSTYYLASNPNGYTTNVGTVTSVGLSSATSGVTIGSTPITTSGTITLAIATASGSQQGLLSSTDWTTFNSKQSALTNPVTGTGTTNYLPKFTGTSTIGNSLVYDNGTNVGIGTTSPATLLQVKGNGNNMISVQYAADGGAAGYGFYNSAGTELWSIGGGRFVAQDALEISRQGSLKFLINSSGNVGIGTASPISYSNKATLGIQGAWGGQLDIMVGSTSHAQFGSDNYDTGLSCRIQSQDGIVFKANGASEKMRITSGGDVCIGNTSGLISAANRGNLTINGATDSILAFGIGGSYSGYVYSSSSSLELDARGSRFIQFNTNSEIRMRILSTGDVCIGNNTNPYAITNRGSIFLNGASSVLYGLGVGGTSKGYIYHEGTNLYIENSVSGGNLYMVSGGSNGVYLASGGTSWTSNSDERLKNINSIIDNALGKLMSLRAVNFSWKSDSSNKEVLGLIAQDVEKVFPQVIDRTKLASNPNKKQTDDTEYLGVRYQDLVPVLIKAIQEQQTQIEQLKNK
jgi:hypothetical protein